MTTDPTALALKIQSYIQANPNVKYSTLEARAKGHGIESHVFESAMELVHRRVWIKKTPCLDTDIAYTVVITVAKPPDTSWWEWCRDNYPHPGKNGVPVFVMPFPEWDLSWLILKPEEMARYHAQMRGVAYIPRKRYGRQDTTTSTQVPTR